MASAVAACRAAGAVVGLARSPGNSPWTLRPWTLLRLLSLLSLLDSPETSQLTIQLRLLHACKYWFYVLAFNKLPTLTRQQHTVTTSFVSKDRVADQIMRMLPSSMMLSLLVAGVGASSLNVAKADIKEGAITRRTLSAQRQVRIQRQVVRTRLAASTDRAVVPNTIEEPHLLTVVLRYFNMSRNIRLLERRKDCPGVELLVSSSGQLSWEHSRYSSRFFS